MTASNMVWHHIAELFNALRDLFQVHFPIFTCFIIQTVLITDTDWCFDLTNLYCCSSHYLYPQFCFHTGMGKVLNLQGPSWIVFFPHSKSLPRRAPALLECLHAVLPESVRAELSCLTKEKQSECRASGSWGPLLVSSSCIHKGFSHVHT